jgi:hypothetical protein
MATRNTEYTLRATSPLLRTGFEIESGPVSEKYVVEEARKLIEFCREINRRENGECTCDDPAERCDDCPEAPVDKASVTVVPHAGETTGSVSICCEG